MSADELYETTMNPENRKLVPLTTENFQSTLDLYEELMGKSPSARKDFILKNKLSRMDDEDLFEEEDYDDED